MPKVLLHLKGVTKNLVGHTYIPRVQTCCCLGSVGLVVTLPTRDLFLHSIHSKSLISPLFTCFLVTQIQELHVCTYILEAQLFRNRIYVIICENRIYRAQPSLYQKLQFDCKYF